MTAPTRTRDPLRGKALGYFRDFRLQIRAAAGVADCRPDMVFAKVWPAAGDHSGGSVTVDVTCVDGEWSCTGKACRDACAHLLVVQMATGWGELNGRGNRWSESDPSEDLQWPDEGPS